MSRDRANDESIGRVERRAAQDERRAAEVERRAAQDERRASEDERREINGLAKENEAGDDNGATFANNGHNRTKWIFGFLVSGIIFGLYASKQHK